MKEKLADEIISFIEENIATSASVAPAAEAAADAPKETDIPVPAATETESPAAEAGINKAKM